MSPPLRVLSFAVLAQVATACATTTTQLAPVALVDVKAEELAQRQLVLRELARAQGRLDSLSLPLLVAARDVCPKKAGPRIGIRYATVHDYKGDWARAAREGLSLGDTLTVLGVTPGSPAALAGITRGDRIVSVNEQPVPTGKGASAAASSAFASRDSAASILRIRRAVGDVTVEVTPVTLCNVGAIVTAEGDINAFADGQNIIFPWAMMRFASDAELQTVIAHEIAHNAMGHIEARKANAATGAFFGALLDIAAASQGVNTYGENTANFMSAAAVAFSQDFEREADYVGLYIMARAGLPLDAAPNLWRQFAQINPQAIGYASTHPTTAERFVRLRNAIREIEEKRSAERPLLPEMKARPQGAR